MAVHGAVLYWVTCDGCGEPAGDVGCPIEDYRRTAAEALDAAIDGADWQTDPTTGELRCLNCQPDTGQP